MRLPRGRRPPCLVTMHAAARSEPLIYDILLRIDGLSFRRVLYISIHRGNGFYPGTGHVEEVGIGDGRGFTLNMPWLKVRGSLHVLEAEFSNCCIMPRRGPPR